MFHYELANKPETGIHYRTAVLTRWVASTPVQHHIQVEQLSWNSPHAACGDTGRADSTATNVANTNGRA